MTQETKKHIVVVNVERFKVVLNRFIILGILWKFFLNLARQTLQLLICGVDHLALKMSSLKLHRQNAHVIDFIRISTTFPTSRISTLCTELTQP